MSYFIECRYHYYAEHGVHDKQIIHKDIFDTMDEALKACMTLANGYAKDAIRGLDGISFINNIVLILTGRFHGNNFEDYYILKIHEI